MLKVIYICIFASIMYLFFAVLLSCSMNDTEELLQQGECTEVMFNGSIYVNGVQTLDVSCNDGLSVDCLAGTWLSADYKDTLTFKDSTKFYMNNSYGFYTLYDSSVNVVKDASAIEFTLGAFVRNDSLFLSAPIQNTDDSIYVKIETCKL